MNLFRSIFLLFLLPALAWSATYYVSPQGNDALTCSAATSPSTRKRTVRSGATCLQSGDTLVIGDGTYGECLLDQIPSGLSAAQPTIVRAEHRRQAVLTGPGVPCSDALIQIGQRGSATSQGLVRHFITLDGLVLDMPTDRGVFGVKPLGGLEDGSPNGSHDLQFLNLEIRGGRNTGSVSSFTIGVGQGGNQLRWTFRGNWFHDIGMVGLEEGQGAFSYGVYLSGSDNVIEQNEFGPNISGYAIHGYSTSDHFRTNLVRNNYFHDVLGPAMLVCGSDNEMYNNIIAQVGHHPYHNAYAGALLLSGSCSGVRADNNRLFNNTFTRNVSVSGGQGPCITLGSQGGGTNSSANNNVIRNNICWNNSDDQIAWSVNANNTGNVVDHNLCSGDGCNVYSPPDGTSLFVTEIPGGNLADQGIKDVDFQLRAGSPAINQGLSTETGTPRFTTDYGGQPRQVGAQDQGAWEFGGSGVAATHRVCQHGRCVSVPGVGADACTDDAGCAIIPPPLIASGVHWPLDDCEGTVATDTSGNHLTGTLSASPAPRWIPGPVGSCALRFQDAPTTVTSSSFTWAPGQPVTVTFWLLAHDCSGGGCGTFTVGNQGNPQSFDVYAPWNDHRLYWEYGNTAAGGSISVDYRAYMERWTFVALTSTGTNMMQVYLNGERVAAEAHASAPTMPLTGLTLGAYGSRYAHGDIDDFQIVGAVLSADEIADMYRRPARR